MTRLNLLTLEELEVTGYRVEESNLRKQIRFLDFLDDKFLLYTEKDQPSSYEI